MYVEELKIPDELITLLNEGRWPQNSDEALQQNGQSLIPSEMVQKLAPEESKIFFIAPPFGTVETFHRNGETFWNHPMSASDEISFAKSVIIADFGIGSDAPILLDYRVDNRKPVVIRLRWSPRGENNHWVKMADSFREFADILGLSSVRFLKR